MITNNQKFKGILLSPPQRVEPKFRMEEGEFWKANVLEWDGTISYVYAQPSGDEVNVGYLTYKEIVRGVRRPGLSVQTVSRKYFYENVIPGTMIKLKKFVMPTAG